MKSVIPILYNQVSIDANADEADVLDQVWAVSKALRELGYEPLHVPFTDIVTDTVEVLTKVKPTLVFNLTESAASKGRLSYVAPSILELFNIPYTGCSAEAIFLTTNKVVCKKLLQSAMLPTPAWLTINEDKGFVKGERYILKPVDEDGSVHITQESVVTGESIECVQEQLERLTKKNNNAFFAERFIEGREFNISMIGSFGHPKVLPAAEIRYLGFKEKQKLEILDYKSKWVEESFEYNNTVPSHDFLSEDEGMLKLLEEYSKRCWVEFGLKGYARVDFRVDQEGNPWVLEVNANPCITPDASGFIRSAELAGMTYTNVIKRFMEEATVQC